MDGDFIAGEFALSPDDADFLLSMIERAHQPFVIRPFAGDIATEWQWRWTRSQGKGTPDPMARVWGGSTAAATALKVAYSGTGRQVALKDQKPFPMDEAVSVILKNWPGIALDAPEREWSAKPAIRALDRLRLDLQARREMADSDSLRSGGRMTTAWR